MCGVQRPITSAVLTEEECVKALELHRRQFSEEHHGVVARVKPVPTKAAKEADIADSKEQNAKDDAHDQKGCVSSDDISEWDDFEYGAQSDDEPLQKATTNVSIHGAPKYEHRVSVKPTKFNPNGGGDTVAGTQVRVGRSFKLCLIGLGDNFEDGNFDAAYGYVSWAKKNFLEADFSSTGENWRDGRRLKIDPKFAGFKLHDIGPLIEATMQGLQKSNPEVTRKVADKIVRLHLSHADSVHKVIGDGIVVFLDHKGRPFLDGRLEIQCSDTDSESSSSDEGAEDDVVEHENVASEAGEAEEISEVSEEISEVSYTSDDSYEIPTDGGKSSNASSDDDLDVGVTSDCASEQPIDDRSDESDVGDGKESEKEEEESEDDVVMQVANNGDHKPFYKGNADRADLSDEDE